MEIHQSQYFGDQNSCTSVEAYRSHFIIELIGQQAKSGSFMTVFFTYICVLFPGGKLQEAKIELYAESELSLDLKV